ncbi:MAG: protein kinase [Kofleriaceae bacterium]
MRDLVDELLQAKVKTTLFGADHRIVRLERWELVDRIGSGAMGTVFAAYDPKLERQVAIKVLNSADAAERVLVEGRALAKLAHPNVVAVFDAGEVDGLVYIVMEVAPGGPLRTWARDRPWRAVMHALRDAATGIAAAHEVGLVHRDLKPDNILVGDDRACVVDFGLAQTGDAGDSAGMPYYMAPEVLAGHTATVASDQYSFGVTLFEVLYGQRPGDGAKPPAGTSVPTWVHAIIVRTLAGEPGERFPNMHEVVRALRRDRRRARFAAILVATAVTGAALGAWTMHHPAGDACADAAVHRTAVWNEAMRSGVKSGLGAVPWAARTLAAFDDAGARWEASYRHVCEATRVHGNRSDALLELRMRCLDRALDRLGALASALAGPKESRTTPDTPNGAPSSSLDASARAAAPAAVASLPLATECETLTDPAELALPRDPVERERARAAEHELDRGWAAFALGRYRDARSIASQTIATLAKLEAPAVRAAALVLAAAVEARIGTPADAHAQLQAALDAAANAHSGALELDVWARMLRSELFAGDPAHVIEWAPFARAAAARANRQGAELDGIVAEAERDAGHLRAAKALLDHALASTDPLRPDQIAVLELDVASIDLALGDSPAAQQLLTKARDRVIGVFGDRHPELALYDDKLAAAARARGRLRDALALHDHSAQLRIAAFGAEDRAVSTSLYHRAETELEAGELGKAEHSLHAAIAIREHVYGATSPRLGELWAAIGEVQVARDDAAGAHDYLAKAAQLDPRLARNADQVPPLAPDELLSTERAQALLHAPEIHARYRADLDPAITVAIARAWFAGGEHVKSAELFATALAHAGEEPNRTALDAAIGLSQCDDPRAAQAARTAISLFQAMPELGRAQMPLMQQIANR